MEKIQVTCEMEVTLKMIGGKCKPLILESLIQHSPQRFSSLLHNITQLSQRTLTNTFLLKLFSVALILTIFHKEYSEYHNVHG